jgi:hypothetical protein
MPPQRLWQLVPQIRRADAVHEIGAETAVDPQRDSG